MNHQTSRGASPAGLCLPLEPPARGHSEPTTQGVLDGRLRESLGKGHPNAQPLLDPSLQLLKDRSVLLK